MKISQNKIFLFLPILLIHDPCKVIFSTPCIYIYIYILVRVSRLLPNQGPVSQSISKLAHEHDPQLGLVANDELIPVPQSYFLWFRSSPTRGARLPKHCKGWYTWAFDVGKRERRNINKHHMYNALDESNPYGTYILQPITCSMS